MGYLNMTKALRTSGKNIQTSKLRNKGIDRPAQLLPPMNQPLGPIVFFLASNCYARGVIWTKQL